MPANNPAKGIDVSRHRGHVDWQQVRDAGITFAFAKATDFTTSVDPLFEENWEEMRRVGLMRGAFHFFRSHLDPAAQADQYALFYAACKGLPSNLGAVFAYALSWQDDRNNEGFLRWNPHAHRWEVTPMAMRLGSQIA